MLGPPLLAAAGVVVIATAGTVFEVVLGAIALAGAVAAVVVLWPQIALGRTHVVLRPDAVVHHRPDATVVLPWTEVAAVRLHRGGFDSYLAFLPADGAGRPRGPLWQFAVRCNRRLLPGLRRAETDHLVLLPRWELRELNEIDTYVRNAAPLVPLIRD